ncbi:hypothetical protein NIES2119_25560 [[Phormidium ambiguum] IAM M-71]|uniref:Filamentous haemagglutinin FhaB/tRNA nuclease CdiA-like TPS domain-containing protein n=1 Tax=[Phormidium ambiguum] IAM M-71 TaxID=454136 RepID=A0A1U7I8A4_9CYAN|nr:S-layer family protein [Phormidium ambiguum]OKH32652.1 hypothetical protein NIES2119_25560 [Phormidium ambiguum IAM M-71]
MKLRLCPFWLFNGSTVFFLYSSNPITAQIVPDATLPINSTVIQQGNISIIEGGTTAGTNLFHSFKSFSIPTDSSAVFNNVNNIQNIFSRVTGSSISNIDGLIRANGTANLFLINPNGIIFGQNAQLNIGGSFIASTASSIRFADGIEFSATNPQNSPLLTINVPIGLQFAANNQNQNASIIVQGIGNNLSINIAQENIINNRPIGLAVPSNKTLALVGGDITLVGGNLTAENGLIELGSVTPGSFVTLTPINTIWQLGYEKVKSFQNISLKQAASVDVSGSGGGSVQVQGRHVTISEGSAILSVTVGSNSGGTLKIGATESVELRNFGKDGKFPSRLTSQVEPKATGNGADVIIETGQLLLQNGAQVITLTSGAGKSGSLTVKASDSVRLIATWPLGSTDIASALYVVTYPNSTGEGGNLTIETGSLIIQDGAQISTPALGQAKGGNLTVRATNFIEAVGIQPNKIFSSGIGASAQPNSTGDGGDLIIETKRLTVRDGAQISSDTLGEGKAGTLTIKATDSIEVTGIVAGKEHDIPSGLLAKAYSKSTGDGGDLKIETGQLIVRNGATVTVQNDGIGKAGTLRVFAEQVKLFNQGSVKGDTNGGGGSIELKSPKIILRNSSITTNAKGGESGGDINIEARFLQLRDRSRITTNASGSNTTGGNINFNLNNGFLIAQENSDITANAEQSRGGKIAIEAEAIFGAVPRNRDELQVLLNTKNANLIDPKNLFTSDITAISQQGDPQLQGIITINTPDIDPNSGLVELSVNFVDPTQLIVTGCPANRGNSFTVTGRGGLPPLPNEPIRPNNTVLVDWVGDIQQETSRNSEVQRSISSNQKNMGIVEATGWVRDEEGKIILIVSAPSITTNSNSFTISSCP